MASSGVPVPTAADANAVVAYSTFNSLRLHQVFPSLSSQSIVGRLIRFWDTRNVHKTGEFMAITILLLDEQVFIVSNLILIRSKYY